MAAIESFLNRQIGFTPKEKVGIGGFSLFSNINESVTLAQEVPVVFLENGTNQSEHMIKSPVAVKIQGEVGDVFERQSELSKQFNRLLNETGNITEFLPARSASQVQKVASIVNDAMDAVRRADDILDSGVQALNFFGNKDTSSKTLGEQFIDAMEAVYYGNQLITVDTQYRSYESMAIINLVTERNNQDNATRFTIDLQKFNFGELQFVEIVGAPKPAPSLGGQTDGRSEKGVQGGSEPSQSALSSILGAVL